MKKIISSIFLLFLVVGQFGVNIDIALASTRISPERRIENIIRSLPEQEKEVIRNKLDDMTTAEKEAFIENFVKENSDNKINDKVITDDNDKDEIDSNIRKLPFFNSDNETPWYKNWEAWGVILAVLGAIAASIGYFVSKRKSKLTTHYFKEIDDVYSSYKLKGYRCEAELYRVRDMISEDFKGGKMDEGSFQLLDGRVEKYLSEVREGIINQRFGGMPENLKAELTNMLGSGEITEAEYKKFHELIGKSTLSSEDKSSLNTLVKNWKEEDK